MHRTTTRALLAAATLLATPALFGGCVAVPPEVKADFTPDDGVRPNHYRLKPGWKPGSYRAPQPRDPGAPEGGR